VLQSIDSLHLGALSLADAQVLIEKLPCVGPIHPRDLIGLFQHAEGLPGGLVRLAHAMAGRQRALFPPLREPCPHLDEPS